MRDLTLARQEFFGGVVLFIGIIVLAKWVLIPQGQLFQYYWQMTKRNDYQQQALRSLPVMWDNKEETLQQQVTPLLYTISSQSHVVVSHIQTNPAKPSMLHGMSPDVKMVSVVIIANGAYGALQHFIEQVIQRYPYALVKDVHLKNIDQHMTTPEESPVLQATLKMDMLVLDRLM